MYLNIINPIGHAYSVDLTIPLWRLELARWGTNPQDPSKQPYLGLVLRYVTGAVVLGEVIQTATQMVYVAGLDTKTSGDELAVIVSKGFPHESRADNTRAFEEALGALHNGIDKAAEADEIIQRALGLAAIRHDLLDALWGVKPGGLDALGPALTGTYEGYRYALVGNRFERWMGTGASMGDGSGLVIVPPGAPKLGNLTKSKAIKVTTPKEPETLAPM